MEATTKPEESCRAFDAITQELDPNQLHRFLVGDDELPRPMPPATIEAELADPIATLLLAKGIFPRTPSELIDAIDDATEDGDPLGQESQLSFLLGEGSQIPMSNETRRLNRGLRFIVTRGQGPEGPDVLLSAADPDGEFIEVMAWDQASGGFNYYRTVSAGGAWVFAGNSLQAVAGPTQRKGPFESHTGGNFLMKEFRFPWLHWHSFAVNIFPQAFADDDPRRAHPWITNRSGADVCELEVAKPAIDRWTRVRFDQILGDDGQVEDPGRVLEHVLGTPTVNLFSSQTASGAAADTDSVDLPQTFFIDSEALTEILGLEPPPPFAVSSQIYRQSLQTFEVTLRGSGGFEQPGDTHFAFAIPEPAIEDNAALREALARGLLSPRLAAALLMVDFPNPIFSSRRQRLQAHVPQTASVVDGASELSEQMAERIIAAADDAGSDSPEAEFAELWGVGEEFQQPFNQILGSYYAEITQRLTSQEGFDAFMRLAESRRARVRPMPIFENPLLFAETNITAQERVMRRDATVAELTVEPS